MINKGSKMLWVRVSAISFVSYLLGSTAALAETVTATCYGPSGPRVDFIAGEVKESKDGFSNSNPTFFFSTKDPEFLIESWQAALPFPEMIGRESVDEIAPPTVSKSVVLFRTPSVIYALSKEGRDAYTTTLYLEENFAIFTRVRLEKGGLTSNPTGSMFTSKCSITVIP